MRQDERRLMSDYLKLMLEYHGENAGSALGAMGWLYISMNRGPLTGVLDNIATYNLFGCRNTGFALFS